MPNLTMPVNINQRYTENDPIIQSVGCAVCCATDVASYYGNTSYTLSDMKNAGVYTVSSAWCQWSNVPDADFESKEYSTQSDYYTKIKSEINASRPVIIYMTGEFNHYVVAYGYTGTCSNAASVNVLDPYGVNAQTSEGRWITLEEAFNIQNASAINHLQLTSAE